MALVCFNILTNSKVIRGIPILFTTVNSAKPAVYQFLFTTVNSAKPAVYQFLFTTVNQTGVFSRTLCRSVRGGVPLNKTHE